MTSTAPRRSLTGVLALPLLLTGCVFSIGCVMAWGPSAWVGDQETRSVPAAGIAKVTCTTASGAISAVGSDVVEIVITINKQGGGADELDAADCLKAIEIVQEIKGDELLLGWRYTEPKRADWGARVAFDIQVPSAVALHADTHNGDITVHNLTRGVTLSSHNGDIEIASCVGPTTVSTHNGSITGAVDSPALNVVTHNGDIEVQVGGDHAVAGSIETHNGRVVVDVGEGVSTEVSCRTHSGGINASGAKMITSTGKRTAVATFGAGEGRLEIETFNGSITVR